MVLPLRRTRLLIPALGEVSVWIVARGLLLNGSRVELSFEQDEHPPKVFCAQHGPRTPARWAAGGQTLKINQAVIVHGVAWEEARVRHAPLSRSCVSAGSDVGGALGRMRAGRRTGVSGGGWGRRVSIQLARRIHVPLGSPHPLSIHAPDHRGTLRAAVNRAEGVRYSEVNKSPGGCGWLPPLASLPGCLVT